LIIGRGPIYAPNTSNPSLYRVTTPSSAPAILRETSEGTSYQTVRLVFRPYTQLRRPICTSESLRTSTGVSSGFVPTGNSSPSFGSQRDRSRCTYSCPRSAPRPRARFLRFRFHLRLRVLDKPSARVRARLLGPCFKTGRMKPRLGLTARADAVLTSGLRFRFAILRPVQRRPERWRTRTPKG